VSIERLKAMIPDIHARLVDLQYDVEDLRPGKDAFFWSGSGTCVAIGEFDGEIGFIVYARMNERPDEDDLQGRAFPFRVVSGTTEEIVSIVASALEQISSLGWSTPKTWRPLSRVSWVLKDKTPVLFEDETVGVTREEDGFYVYVWGDEGWEEIDQLDWSAGNDEPGGNLVHTSAFWRNVAYRTLQAHAKRSARTLRRLSRQVPHWNAALAAWVIG